MCGAFQSGPITARVLKCVLYKSWELLSSILLTVHEVGHNGKHIEEKRV